MGGTINLTVRFEDGQQHRRTMNGGAVKKATNALGCIHGDREHWEPFLEQGHAGPLAPHMHGLVVVDYEKEFILFMHNNYAPGLFYSSEIEPHPPADAPPKGVKTDRFRDELVELIEAERIDRVILGKSGEYPLTGTPVVHRLCDWSIDEIDRLNDQVFDPLVFIDYGPELHRLDFETDESAPMQTVVEGLGFELSDEERADWKQWQDGHFT